MDLITPSPRQLQFHQWERGIFIHFGLRTFHEGFRDMDERRMSLENFMPEDLDCDQWAATAKAAGFNYMVMTAKHHDGFANWPSKTTDFSVANTPWRDGKGDVVSEFVEACRRHDVHPGLYYSPFDQACPVYEDEGAYDDFFIQQISEILEPFGEIDILWFDGCGSEGHQYDWGRIVGEIRRMQPGILIFNMGDPDIRWIGNEEGFAPLDTRCVADHVPFSINDTEGDRTEKRWLVPECDCRMRERNWFYSDQDEHTVKSVDELMGMYYYSVGRGANLLLNIGPDRRGKLPDADAARLGEFHAEIQRRIASPFATLAEASQEGNVWKVSRPEVFACDHAIVAEDIAQGERIARFAIRANVHNNHKPITVFEGRWPGARAVCQFPTIRARNIWMEVEECEGEPQVARLDFCYSAR